jgi:hypothetical protein
MNKIQNIKDIVSLTIAKVEILKMTADENVRRYISKPDQELLAKTIKEIDDILLNYKYN